jgi:hypothetical protein
MPLHKEIDQNFIHIQMLKQQLEECGISIRRKKNDGNASARKSQQHTKVIFALVLHMCSIKLVNLKAENHKRSTQLKSQEIHPG